MHVPLPPSDNLFWKESSFPACAAKKYMFPWKISDSTITKFTLQSIKTDDDDDDDDDGDDDDKVYIFRKF